MTKQKAENRIVQSGSTYKIYGNPVITHKSLPVGTYTVEFHPDQGYWLQKSADMLPKNEPFYGNAEARIKRVVTTYGKMKRSYGVLMSGHGGMGKTMLMRSIAHKMQNTYHLPIIIVNKNTPSIATYLDTLDEAIVVFDEFEKTFDEEDQQQFLSLFDGLSLTKRMYIVAVNDTYNLTNHIVNRTGRFHTHLEFDYPKDNEVRTYLLDHGVDEVEAEKVVAFSRNNALNYDHLRAIAFELVDIGGEFEDIIADMNIKTSIHKKEYAINVSFEKDDLQAQTKVINGNTIAIKGYYDLDESEEYFNFKIQYDQDKIKMSKDFESIYLSGRDVEIHTNDPDMRKLIDKKLGKVKRIEFEERQTQTFF